MRIRPTPSFQEIQQLIGRLDPNIGFGFAPFRTDQHTQAMPFQGLESVFIGGIVAQIRHRRAGGKLLQYFADGIALVRFGRTQFNAAVKLQQLHFSMARNL